MRKLFTLFLALSSTLFAFSQTVERQPGPIIVCPAGEFDGHHHVPAAEWIRESMENHQSSLRGTGTSCANIQVTYNGFTPEAQAAFQAAVDIWEASLSSDVTIKVDANWTVLGEGVLGSAGPAGVFRFFDNAPDDNYYASALADKIAGFDQDAGEPDINANFNSDFDWYLGTDGNTPDNQYDLTSVVLHELGHGLGFVSSKNYDEDSGEGTFGLGFQEIPLNYDVFLTLGANGNELLDIPNGTVLGDAFTSNNVYNNSTEAIAANGGTAPRIYAPTEYAGGSSISHWNESTYTAGDPNSLMTPQIGSGEAIHNPGGITLGLFEDMGWTLCESVVIDCAIVPLTLDGPESICPGASTTVEVTQTPTIPTGGNVGIQFLDVANQEFITLTGVTLPYSFDNDLNGVLSANGFDPFVGEYELTAIVYTDVNDLEGSTCATANSPVTVYFLEDSDPSCSGDACSIDPLILDGPESICPTETTTVEIATPAEVPAGGGVGIQFTDVANQTAINLTGVALPYAFDNDLNGLLSANGFDLFVGEYELTAFVYSDVTDLEGTICAINSVPLTVYFLEENDPACNGGEDCSIGQLGIDGPESICPAETTTVEVDAPAEVPTDGGVAISFVEVATQTGINLTGVTLPYTFDNDLNGLLSTNGFDSFVGEYELTAFIYTDINDVEGTACSLSNTVTVYFLEENDPACNPDPTPCDEWVSPSSTAGYIDFNNEFGGAPCDDGSGCPFNEIQAFEVWGSEAYSVDNFMAGGTYTFSICNGPGAGSWTPDFTIIAPSGTIDAFGSGDGCSITWTASEDGTYLIVINEMGNCGVSNQINNGYPALTCEDGTADCSVEEPCSIDPLSLDGPANICPGISTTVETNNVPEVPMSGGIAIEFLNVATQEAINLTSVSLPYTFDNDLNGLLSANNLDPFTGEYELTAFVYTDEGNLAESTCAVADASITVDFLLENDPDCVSSMNEKNWDKAWEIYPNPATEEVTIKLKTQVDGNISVTLYDVSGRILQQKTNIKSGENSTWQFPISHLTQGVYYIEIESSSFKATKPLLIQK